MKNCVVLMVGCALAGCVGIGRIQPGMSAADVENTWGKPTQVHALQSGSRLIYTQGTFAHSVRVVDLNEKGSVTRSYEAMTAETLAKVRVGMSRRDVEREIGPAFWVKGRGTAVYKYREPSWGRCFYVDYSEAGVVSAVGGGDERRPSDLMPGEREC